MRRVATVLVLAAAMVAVGGPAYADTRTDGTPTVESEALKPGSEGEPTGPAEPTGSDDEPAPLSPEWQAYVDCVNAGRNCLIATPLGDGEPPTIDPATLAQSAVDSAPLHLPAPHTSPPEGGFQLTGVETWFWLDPETWEPVTARAELPGIWAEVTATPVSASWDPGDGSAAVVCEGPGREHPGTLGATTECGHTFDDVGDYTVTVEVTWAVTWRSSTGAAGELDAITVDAALPLEVQQREAVTD